MGVSSDLLEGPTGRLNASQAGVTRVGTALARSRGCTPGGGRLLLTPSVEVGLRSDGGKAEEGAGMNVGGGLAFSDLVGTLTLGAGARRALIVRRGHRAPVAISTYLRQTAILGV